MAIPTNSGGEMFADINITPLTDIFLVLLIIFMVAAAVTIESAAHVALPRTKAPAHSRQVGSVVVSLTSDRHIYVGAHEVALRALEPALRQELDASPDKTVIFKGDPQVLLGDMVIILDLAKRAGAQQLGVAVGQSPSPTEVITPDDPTQ